MSTIAEIKDAVDKLSPDQREELEALLWPDWDRAEGDTPPGVREKLAEAARGRFTPGNRSNLDKLRASPE